MLYKSMTECVLYLEKHGHLVRVQEEIDPNLEMAEFYEHSWILITPALPGFFPGNRYPQRWGTIVDKWSQDTVKKDL